MKATFKKWDASTKKQVKKLQASGDMMGAAWLANAHAKQIISLYR